MLVGFAAGIANLAWMAALTLVMLYEKTGKGGRMRAPAVIVGGRVAAAVAQVY